VQKWQATPTFWMATAALLVAMAAFVVAISGVATASPKVIVRKGDIAPGAVTAKSIAPGAVTAAKLRKNAVTGPKLAKASVTARSLAADAVTTAAIAPGSVSGPELGVEEVVTKPISDLDKVAHNGEWTASNVEVALCGPGAALMGAGFAFTAINNGESEWTQSLPVINGETRGVAGRFVSDAGGSATGEVAAICLR
jgi:hypothetical protein